MEHGHGGAGVGGDAGGEDTEKMWKYQWTMSPLLRYMVVVAMGNGDCDGDGNGDCDGDGNGDRRHC